MSSSLPAKRPTFHYYLDANLGERRSFEELRTREQLRRVVVERGGLALLTEYEECWNRLLLVELRGESSMKVIVPKIGIEIIRQLDRTNAEFLRLLEMCDEVLVLEPVRKSEPVADFLENLGFSEHVDHYAATAFRRVTNER